jgi:hypothetical protein
MMFCSSCGSPLAPAASRQVAPVAARASLPETSPLSENDSPASRAAPPSEPAQSVGVQTDTRRRLNIGLDDVLAGDWAGAAVIAIAGWITAMVSSCLLAALALSPGIDWKLLLAMTEGLSGAAFGGAIQMSITDTTEAFGGYPLSITVLALGVMVLIFRRRAAVLSRATEGRTPSARLVLHLIQVARIGLVFAMVQLAAALVLRMTFSQPILFSSTGRISVSPAAPAIIGFLLVSAVLSLSVVLGSASMPLWTGRVRRFASLPLRALTYGFVGASLATGLTMALLVVTDHSYYQRASTATVLACLPNFTIWALALGMGIGLHAGSAFQGIPGLGNFSGSFYVTNLVDSQGLWYWLLSVGAVLTFLAIALLVVRLSGNAVTSRRNAVITFALATVGSPFIAHFSTLSIQAQGISSPAGSVSFGPPWPTALFVTVLWAIGAILVASAVSVAREGKSASDAGLSAGMPPQVFDDAVPLASSND